MSDICLDNEIIDTLRKSSVQKKGDKEHGRIFIVRESKKNCTNENDSNRSLNEMSCGDYAASQPPPPSRMSCIKTCQLNVTEPIICTISNPVETCSPANDCEKAASKRGKRKCPKLNVKKTSRICLPASNQHAICSCGGLLADGKVNIARKLLGPYPDEIGLSIFSRIAIMFHHMAGNTNFDDGC